MNAIAQGFNKLFTRAPGFMAMMRKETRDEVEYDFSESDLEITEVDVPTKRDLPIQGKSSVKYRTLDDMNMWSWLNGKYVEYNPYGYGGTTAYREKPEVMIVEKKSEPVSNMLFEDERQLASISIDQVREGADARLALVYNIDAFREDIRVIVQYSQKFSSMVSDKKDRPYFRNDDQQNMRDNWFSQNHSALSLLLRSSCRSATHLDRNMLDAIHGKGAHLWWDEKAGNAKFKDGEFEVNL